MQKTALLLVQLGSPKELSVESVENYLYDFLGDWHTIGKKLFFWKFLLKHCILPKGKFTSYCKYKSMFDSHALNEMPLVLHSREFLEGVKKILLDKHVELAYQYGCEPSIKHCLQKFLNLNVQDVKVVPLYPQRSGVTTKAAIDMVLQIAKEIHFKGHFSYAEGFYHTAPWVREIASSIKEHLKDEDTLVLSWHAIQAWRIKKGDPYEHDCVESAKAIGNFLGVKPVIAYQSKFGNGKWLGPSLKEIVSKLGQEHKPIVIASPVFTADNLETISEIDDEINILYKNNGGVRLKRVPCLNARPSWVTSFAEEILPSLKFKEF